MIGLRSYVLGLSLVDTRQPRDYQGDVNTNWTPEYYLVAFHDNYEQPTTAETNSCLLARRELGRQHKVRLERSTSLLFLSRRDNLNSVISKSPLFRTQNKPFSLDVPSRHLLPTISNSRYFELLYFLSPPRFRNSGTRLELYWTYCVNDFNVNSSKVSDPNIQNLF